MAEMSASNQPSVEYKVGKRGRGERIHGMQQKAYSESPAQMSQQERKVLGRLNANSCRPLRPQASSNDHRNRRSSSTSSASSCSSIAYSSSGSSHMQVSAEERQAAAQGKAPNAAPAKRAGGCHGLVFIVPEGVLHSAEKEIALELEPRICAAVRLLNRGLPVFLLDLRCTLLRAGFELAQQDSTCRAQSQPRIYIKRTCLVEPIPLERVGHIVDCSQAKATVTLNQLQVEELARVFIHARAASKGLTAIEMESDGLSSSSESTSVSSWASIVKTKPDLVCSQPQQPLSTPASEFSSLTGFSDDSSVNTVDAEMLMMSSRLRGYSSELEVTESHQDKISTCETIHAAVTEFVRYVDASISGFGPALSPEDVATVGYSGSDAFQLFTSIQSLISAIFPQACVEIYGSLSTGLWLPGQSDLDLIINLQQYRIPPNSMLHHAPPPPPPPIPMNPLLYNGPQGLRDFALMQERIRINNYYQSWARFTNQLLLQGGDIEIISLSREELLAHLATLQNALKVQPWCESTKLIARAEMPVVKLLAAPVPVPGINSHKSPIPVDISILTGEHKGLQARDYVSLIVSEYPTILRPLILAVKRILREYSLHDTYTGGLGSYSLTLMVAFFLQKCGFVLKSVRVTPKKPDEAADPDLLIAERLIASVVKGLNIATANVGKLLLRFLQLFSPPQNGGLDLSKVGISLSDGMFRHHQSVSLCIRDPTDADHYIGAGSFAMAKVQSLFAEVRTKLVANPSSIYTVLNWKTERVIQVEPVKPLQEAPTDDKAPAEQSSPSQNESIEESSSGSAAVGVIRLPLLESPPDSALIAETAQKCSGPSTDTTDHSMPPALHIKMPSKVLENEKSSCFTGTLVEKQEPDLTTPKKPVSWAQVASSSGSSSRGSLSPGFTDILTPSSETKPKHMPRKKLGGKRVSLSKRSQRLFVGNIDYSAKESDIARLISEFKSFGKVKEVNSHLETGKLWICYRDEKDASAALESMNRKLFLNRRLYVEFSFKTRNRVK